MFGELADDGAGAVGEDRSDVFRSGEGGTFGETVSEECAGAVAVVVGIGEDLAKLRPSFGAFDGGGDVFGQGAAHLGLECVVAEAALGGQI